MLALALAQPVAGRLAQLTGKGRSIEARSDDVEGPVTPAKGAFAIWGPLFLGNIWLSLKALLRRTASPAERRMEWYSALAFAGNTAWSVQAQYAGLGWPSLGIITSSAMSAVAATLEAEREPSTRLTRVGRWANGALAGWLTVATFANLDGTLTHAFGAVPVAQRERRSLLLIGGASAAAIAVAAATRGNAGYAAAAAWGLGGIGLRNVCERRPHIAVAAAAGLAAVAFTALLARCHRE